MESVKASDLFADASSPKKAAKRQEEYLLTLSKSLASASNTMDISQPAVVDPIAQIETLMATKSLTPDAAAALNNALAAQRTAQADIIKDITLDSPLSRGTSFSGFAAFDLEAPAKMLTPRPTPLRNKLARIKGVGNAHRVKRITGFTGTGTGGQSNIFPGISETTQTNFANSGSSNALYYNRGPKIGYTADDIIVPYASFSLSDQVSFDANFSALGYQDLRQLSSTTTLYASMLMEERMLLMSRGTQTGFVGALAAPTVTLSQRAAVTADGEAALTATTYYVYATSDAGAFGESTSSTVQSLAVTSGNVLVVTVNNVSGAIGTNVYVGTSTGNSNAKFQGRFSSLAGVVHAGTSSINDHIIYSTTSTKTAPTADSSAYAAGYDGIIPQLFAYGTVNEVNAQFSTANPGNEFQTVFSQLFDSVKADPDEIWLNGSDRKQLSDAIKNGSTANYRINLSQDDMGNYVGGAVVGAIHNEITGKLVNLTVHPWLPQGVAPVLSYSLPIPDSEVSNVWAVANVQDYMGVQWPVTQFAYETSVYWRGALIGYAPTFNGIVSGIKSA